MMTASRPNRTLQALTVIVTGWLTGAPTLAESISGRVQSAGPAADLSAIVIWVDDIGGLFATPAEHAVITQKNLRFVPHVLAIQAGTSVEFPNVDPVSHNVFSISDPKRFNLGLYGRDVIRRLTFDKPGVVELLCNVHLEMSAYIVVIKNPHFAHPTAEGFYRISGVPAGRHRVRRWSERSPVQERVVDVPEAGSATLDFGVQP